MGVEVVIRPSRWRYCYALELFAIVPNSAPANRVLHLGVNPKVVETTVESAVSETFTAGGVVIEETGLTVADIEIQGTFGLALKRGQNVAGEWIFADGNVLFEHFVAFFDLWSIYKANPQLNATVLMVWHDFIRDKHWVVYPRRIRVPRNAAESRVHRTYDIALRAVAPFESTIKGFFDDGVLGAIKGGVAGAVDALNMVTGYAEDARAFLAETNNYIEGISRDALTAVDALVAAGAGILNGTSETLRAPLRIAQDWTTAIARWTGVLEDALDSDRWSPGSVQARRSLANLDTARSIQTETESLTADPDLWSPTFDERSGARRGAIAGATRPLIDDEVAAGTTTGGGAGLASRVTPGSADRRATERSRAARAQGGPGSTSPGARRYRGQRAVTVREGDSIIGIAVRELGSPDAWVDILDANPDLRPPYISLVALPGTVQPGGTLIVPTVEDVNAAGGPGPALGEDADTAFLGTDFALGEDGEWAVDPTTGDIALVRGVDNVVQAVERVRWRTVLGENLLYPHLGIAAPIGRPGSPGVPAAIAVSARAALATDDRITGVQQVETVVDGDQVSIEFHAAIRGVSGRRVLRQPVR